LMLHATHVKDEESSNYTEQPSYMLHPRSSFSYFWNSAIAVLLLFGALMLPFQFAFFGSEENLDDVRNNTSATILLIMDIFFICDVLVNMRTGFMDDGEVIFDIRKIARLYFNSWLTIDTITAVSSFVVVISSLAELGSDVGESTMGMDAHIASSADARSLSTNIKVMRVIRMLRIVKVFKLVKLSRSHTILDFLDEHIPAEMKTAAKMLKLCVYVSFCTHVLGCGFYFVAVETTGPGGRSWVDAYIEEYYADCGGVDLDRSCVRVHNMYLASLYYAFVTVTTVGYGDIHPITDVERGYAIFCTLVGSGVFAFFVGELTSLATTAHASERAFEEKANEVEEFMSCYRMPKHLRMSIRKYYRKHFKRSWFDVKSILEDLSYDLRRDVSLWLRTDLISKVPFFKSADPSALQLISSMLTPVVVNRGKAIIQIDTKGHAMYWIDKGEVVVELPNAKNADVRLGEGDYFGEIALLSDELTSATIRAVRSCELYELTKDRFTLVLQRYPDLKAKMEKMACERLMQQERFQVGADNALRRWKRANDKLNMINRFRKKGESEDGAYKKVRGEKISLTSAFSRVRHARTAFEHDKAEKEATKVEAMSRKTAQQGMTAKAREAAVAAAAAAGNDSSTLTIISTSSTPSAGGNTSAAASSSAASAYNAEQREKQKERQSRRDSEMRSMSLLLGNIVQQMEGQRKKQDDLMQQVSTMQTTLVGLLTDEEGRPLTPGSPRRSGSPSSPRKGSPLTPSVKYEL